MRKGTLAHKGLLPARSEIGYVSDGARQRSQVSNLFRTDDVVAHLQFQIGDDGAEVGVAAALAVAVDAALDVRGSLLNRSQRVGNSHIRIVVRVDADDSIKAATPTGNYLLQAPRNRPAIGIAKTENI